MMNQDDIRQFGRYYVLMIEDPSDPTPYRWCLVPTHRITYAELEAESWRGFVLATASGQATTRDEMNAQISKALGS